MRPHPTRTARETPFPLKRLNSPTPRCRHLQVLALDRLIDTAKDYARQALGENTNAAYKADWAHFSSWCRRRGADPLGGSGAEPQMIGLYISECASPTPPIKPLTVATIERRLSGLAWHYQQRGFTLDRKNRHIATVLAGIRRKHARPPVQKEAVLAEDILDMIATLSFGLRDQRDRAILLIGYAGGLRRSEIVSLDFGRDDTEDGTGWIKIADQGLILTFHSKTGWREVEIGRGSSDQTCPVHALEQYLHYAKIDFGPLFQRVSRDDRKATGRSAVRQTRGAADQERPCWPRASAATCHKPSA